MTPFGSWVVCATSIKVDEKMNIERMNERFIRVFSDFAVQKYKFSCKMRHFCWQRWRIWQKIANFAADY
jgi:hypothetical protein